LTPQPVSATCFDNDFVAMHGSAPEGVGPFLIALHRRLNVGALQTPRTTAMAKANTIKIKLLSTADTGSFYVTKKNSRTKTEKLSFTKYDPVIRKHVEFKETKIK